MIVLAFESGCVKVVHTEDQDTISAYPELNSNHDEGDTKVILHTIQIFKENVDAVVTIRSPSGNTDIVVLSTGLLQENSERIIFDDSHGGNRKAYILKDIIILL